MATTLKTKNSVTTTVVPTTLAQGELAVNITDKKMWVGNAATTPVQILGAGATNRAGGSNTQVQYNSSGDLAGSANMTFNGTGLTLANDAYIQGMTVGIGGSSVATNTVFGNASLASNTTGSANAAFGFQALTANTTGFNISAFGYQAAKGNTTGQRNTAFGYQSLLTNTTGNFNTAIGERSLSLNTTGSSNIAIGLTALYANTTGGSNVAIGQEALTANTTASNNTAVGYQSLYSNTAGSNTAVGYKAGYSFTGSETYGEVYVGFQAGTATTTGNSNVFVGGYAGYSNTTGNNNTVVGPYALRSNTTGYSNTVVGSIALQLNTSGINNVAIGQQALALSTTASYNTAVGFQALYSNTTAIQNTAIGDSAGNSNTTGTRLVAVGVDAARTTTGNDITAIGVAAIYGGSGNNNQGFGNNAGRSLTTGNGNLLLGMSSGYSVTTGSGNTFVGPNWTTNGAGYSMTTGQNNTILGPFTGNQSGLDIRTSNNYVVVADGAGKPLMTAYNSGTLALEGAVPVAGTGITFPATQSPSSDANTLDDYEEGTWTPVLKFGTGNTGLTGTFVGKYTKIGNQVSIICFIKITAKGSSTGSANVSGLPFTPASYGGDGPYYSGSIYNQGLIALGSGYVLSPNINGNSNTIDINNYSQVNGGDAGSSSTLFNSTGAFWVSATYLV